MEDNQFSFDDVWTVNQLSVYYFSTVDQYSVLDFDPEVWC